MAWDNYPDYPPHPYSLRGKSGAHEMNSGDIVRHDQTGRFCRLDEALQDGDAYITYSDGSYDIVKWNNLSPTMAGRTMAEFHRGYKTRSIELCAKTIDQNVRRINNTVDRRFEYYFTDGSVLFTAGRGRNFKVKVK